MPTAADRNNRRPASTRTSIELGAYGKTLFTRSEAKRLVQGLSRFTHVTLDFSGVEIVSPGFCDEVLRVFGRAHPEIIFEPVGMNETVAFVVARARRARADGSSLAATSPPRSAPGG